MRNNRGPRDDPWGTPQLISLISESCPCVCVFNIHKNFHLVETKVEKLQNTVGSFQFGAFHIWPFHILGIYFDHSDMGDSSHLIGRHILGHNSRTRVFLDMRFLQNDGESSPLTLYTKLDKSLEQFWRKMTKTPFWPPFWPKTAEPEFFLKIGLSHFFPFRLP